MIGHLRADLIRHRDTTDALLCEIVTLKAQHWNYPIVDQLQWITDNISENDYHLIIKDIENRILAYLNVVSCAVVIDNEILNLMGVGNVCVHSTFKNQKIGYLLMEFCRFYLNQLNKVGVLLCKQHLVPFYTKSKWVQYCGNVYLREVKYEHELFFSSHQFDTALDVKLSKNF